MAMADGADPGHEASRQARDAHLRGGGFLVSTDYVVDETLTLIRTRLGLRAAEQWWAQVDASSLGTNRRAPRPEGTRVVLRMARQGLLPYRLHQLRRDEGTRAHQSAYHRSPLFPGRFRDRAGLFEWISPPPVPKGYRMKRPSTGDL
ncbi:MAG: hypothetical protein OXL34_06005 [Gemmatimonadota bacterium]|nr:hypothetical protein [Gemmatimonadota bacterium]